jgi:hypothetical protein
MTSLFPPLALIAAPLIQRASLQDRNPTTNAISSGIPILSAAVVYQISSLRNPDGVNSMSMLALILSVAFKPTMTLLNVA